jgi:type III secretion protein T
MMEFPLEMPGISELKLYIVTAYIALLRMLGFVFVMPAFTRLGLTGILRTACALAFSIPVLPKIYSVVSPEMISAGELVMILPKEIIIGVLIALVLGIPIWAAEQPGETLDLQRAARFSDMKGLEGETNNVTGTFFSLIIVVMFFTAGGTTIVLDSVYQTYEIWPVKNYFPIFNADTGKLVLKLLDDVFSMGLMLILPIAITFLLSDISLGLVARAAPQMNVFSLSLAIKNLAFLILLALYAVFLVGYMREDLSWLLDGVKKLRLFSALS